MESISTEEADTKISNHGVRFDESQLLEMCNWKFLVIV